VLRNQKDREIMSKKTEILAHPVPTTLIKNAVASSPAEPSSNGKPASDAAVRLRAYEKWEETGKPDGDGVGFWLEAERELLQVK
jgi:hypothetical protein